MMFGHINLRVNNPYISLRIQTIHRSYGLLLRYLCRFRRMKMLDPIRFVYIRAFQYFVFLQYLLRYENNFTG